MTDQPRKTKQVIGTTEELLAYSLALETEAVERFTDLGDQMEIHNNHEVADLFYKLAEIEGKHVENVNKTSAGKELPNILAWEFDWIDECESPEGGAMDEAHYLMQPWHAIELAKHGEQRAVAFFKHVACNATDEAVKEMALELVAEEEEHVELLEQWQQRFPKPDDDWDEDLDPPTIVE